MLLSLPFMFLGPMIIYNAFMNQHTPWHYLALAIGIFLCILAVFFLFSGIKKLVDNLFKADEN
jgi:hypothetical protein